MAKKQDFDKDIHLSSFDDLFQTDESREDMKRKKEVLMIVKKSIEENISERKICEKLGIEQSTFWSRKNKIFKKIKKSFGQN